MKSKLLLPCLLLIAVFFFCNKAHAKNNIAPDPECIGKDNNVSKTELLGTVFQTESRKPLRDVTVTAFASNKKETRTYTDHQGNYSFTDLKPGVYRLVFERDGFRKVSKDKVLIKTDDGFHLDIGMDEEAEYDLIPGIFNFSGEE